MLDWGDGQYERTAEQLTIAAERAIDAAEITAADHVLDLGCGTGNVAIAAARRGARVTGVDPAERLLQTARSRARDENLSITFVLGEAGAIPLPDAAVDVVVSVFAVIFAPDAERAASEMLRVVKPGGRLCITSWLPRGAIAEAAKLLYGALPPAKTEDPPRSAPRWGDADFVRELFESRGAAVDLTLDALVFEAPSAEAWFADQEAHHPAWRAIRRATSELPGVWESVKERSIQLLESASEASDRLRMTSEYWMIRVNAGLK